MVVLQNRLYTPPWSFLPNSPGKPVSLPELCWCVVCISLLLNHKPQNNINMNQVSLFLLAIIFSGILFTSCGSNNSLSTDSMNKDTATTFDLTKMKKIIEEKNNAFAKAFITGDSAGMVNSYAHDAKIFPPNSAAIIGQSAIGPLVSQYLKFGIKEYRDETTALYGNEDNLIEEGDYFMGDGKGNSIDKGKYIVVWRKVDGDWKIYSNMFNSSIPVAPAK